MFDWFKKKETKLEVLEWLIYVILFLILLILIWFF